MSGLAGFRGLGLVGWVRWNGSIVTSNAFGGGGEKILSNQSAAVRYQVLYNTCSIVSFNTTHYHITKVGTKVAPSPTTGNGVSFLFSISFSKKDRWARFTAARGVRCPTSCCIHARSIQAVGGV